MGIWVSGQLHASPLYLRGKSPRYPVDKRLDGLRSRSGRGGVEKNSQPLPGLKPPIIQTVTQRYLFPLYSSFVLSFKMLRRHLSHNSEKEQVYRPVT
jgi:hypothetical protein